MSIAPSLNFWITVYGYANLPRQQTHDGIGNALGKRHIVATEKRAIVQQTFKKCQHSIDFFLSLFYCLRFRISPAQFFADEG